MEALKILRWWFCDLLESIKAYCQTRPDDDIQAFDLKHQPLDEREVKSRLEDDRALRKVGIEG